jgi:hypothetical protein
MSDERRDEGPGKQGGPEGRGPSKPPSNDRNGGSEGGRGETREGSRPNGGEDERRRSGRHRFRGRGHQGRLPGGQAPKDSSPEESRRDLPACPLCGKPVYDLSTALSASRESGEPAHFDCVLERLAAAESLGPQEKLVYLGSGAFGVVEFSDKSETSFSVKRRIQWEKEGEKRDWRKALSSRVSKL